LKKANPNYRQHRSGGTTPKVVGRHLGTLLVFSIVALGDRRIEICWRFQSWEFSLLVQEAFYEQIFINAGGLLACLAQITTVRASDRAIHR
jgi:hypothetical protein